MMYFNQCEDITVLHKFNYILTHSNKEWFKYYRIKIFAFLTPEAFPIPPGTNHQNLTSKVIIFTFVVKKVEKCCDL